VEGRGKSVRGEKEEGVPTIKKYIAYYLVNQDDFCLEESVMSVYREGVTHFLFQIPTTYWDGTPTKKSNQDFIEEFATKLAYDLQLDIHIQTIETNGMGGPYAEREACVRNRAMAEMKSLGFEHVLIVDGDELWRPGALEKLDKWVEEEPLTVRSVSVIGLPGYPVDVKADGLLVYVPIDTLFLHGRSTKQNPTHIDNPAVIHFTSTRRTVEEVIDKQRKSCHYDDEDYDFEGWIIHTLPRLKPGAKNVHMFKKWQVWPEVRGFTQDEWMDIPEVLYEFLGEPEVGDE